MGCWHTHRPLSRVLRARLPQLHQRFHEDLGRVVAQPAVARTPLEPLARWVTAGLRRGARGRACVPDRSRVSSVDGVAQGSHALPAPIPAIMRLQRQRRPGLPLPQARQVLRRQRRHNHPRILQHAPRLHDLLAGILRVRLAGTPQDLAQPLLFHRGDLLRVHVLLLKLLPQLRRDQPVVRKAEGALHPVRGLARRARRSTAARHRAWCCVRGRRPTRRRASGLPANP